MTYHEVVDPIAISLDTACSEESAFDVPCYVEVALKNVYLCHEHKGPPVRHKGDFWHWRLTPYGLDLMRVLVHASVEGFTYAETFMEPEPMHIPQLVLQGQLNAAIQRHLTYPCTPSHWKAILVHNPYLHDKHIFVDMAIFQREIEYLTEQIRKGWYNSSGSRNIDLRLLK